MRKVQPGYYDVLTEAIADIQDHGFESESRLNGWLYDLRDAAERSLIPEEMLIRHVKSVFINQFDRLINQGAILRYHPGVQRWQLEKIKPHLRSELDRRIMASANLIKLNRAEMVDRTLRRFSGWATSIPVGGSDTDSRREVKKSMSLADMSFIERRVMIDQGHKLVAALNDIVATDAGAIAAVWHSHGHDDASYDARPDHLTRDGKVYLIPGNWATEKGLVKSGPDGRADEITQPGQEINCRCKYRYIYSINRLPDDMLTVAGKKAIGRVGIKN